MKWNCLVLALAAFSSICLADKPSKPLPTSLSEYHRDPAIERKSPVLIMYIADVQSKFTSDYHDHLYRTLAALALPRGEATGDDRFLARVREFILFDLELVRLSSETELSDLTDAICARKAVSLDMAIFHNAETPLVVDQNGADVYASWASYRKENESMTKHVWKINNLGPLVKEPGFAAQALSHPAFFQEALDAVQKEFPLEKHRYILIVKGRGDDDYLLKSQYAFDSTNIDGNALRAAFLARRKDFEGDGDTESFEFRAEHSRLVHEILGSVMQPLSSATPGMHKWRALEILARMGGGDPREGMFFSQVILNTSPAQLELAKELKEFATPGDYTRLNVQNIGSIRHFGTSGAYPTMPFHKMFEVFGIDPTTNAEPRFEIRLNALLDFMAKQEEETP